MTCAHFTDTIHDFMNQCIPSKVIRPNDKAWYDFEIRIFSKYRDRQRPIPLVSNTPSSWSKYKTLQNKVNNLKTFAKQKFLTNIENNIETLPVGNSKCYWKAIKDLMKHYKSPDSIPILKRSADCNEELCFEDVDKANCLNDFVTSVSTVDDSNINISLFQPVTDSFIDNVHILKTDIEDIISRHQYSICPDLVSHKLLKNLSHSISGQLCTLFNRSLDEGIFPSYQVT